MNSQNNNDSNRHMYLPFGYSSIERATTPLKVVVAICAVIYLGVNLYFPITRHVPIVIAVFRALLFLALPLLALGIVQFLFGDRSPASKFKIFGIATVLCTLAFLAWYMVPNQVASLFGPDKSKWTATQFKEQATHCMTNRDLECAQENWTEYVRLRPLDGQGLANLGMVLNMRDAHSDAIVQFKKAIEAGTGAYDTFAYYADSLEKIGQFDEAIDWNYRALSVYPTLVDVRGKLASLLVHQKKYHEALALLQAFDDNQKQFPYFQARRISIENLIADAESTNEDPPQTLRLAIQSNHYFIPVKIGNSPAHLFVIDTGATHTTLNLALLNESKVKYRVRNPHVVMVTADGRQISTQEVAINSLRVGPFLLKDVSAIVCDTCNALLGQTTLAKFNMESSRTKGVEFLTLTKR